MKTVGKDKRIWYPFTQMAEFENDDSSVGIPTIVAADGVYLIDEKGNRYIDGVSSLWVNLHGHNHPKINSAIEAQLRKFAHSTLLGLKSEPALKLSKKLSKILPKELTRIFYSDNGSTAVEVALKACYQYWHNLDKKTKRKKFVAFENAYHGDTLGAVSVGGVELFHSIYRDLLFDVLRAPSPYCYRCKFEMTPKSCGMKCLTEFKRLVSENAEKIAAVILEPLVQCAGGIIVHPKGFLKRVKEVCDEHKIPLILDEVAVGFGRTGTMFAFEQEGIVPDVLCLAKGITGGYLPLAVTIFKESVYESFIGEYEKTFFHGHTYTGNALSCAAALANLEIFDEEKSLKKLPPKIKRLTTLLERFKELEIVGDVRQCGFIAGVELVKNKTTKEPFKLSERIGHRVIRRARKYGVIMRPLGNILVFFPPLVIAEEQIELLLDAAFRSTKEVQDELKTHLR
ncbi:MAG: adenosylmethionine--8-amino-7-oxononanoate transaminase [Planctomycetota bacterium]|nr:adenosylmethionine--8-amino-7-oxononanoate transaminase [Planctomycetota bacterium]